MDENSWHDYMDQVYERMEEVRQKRDFDEWLQALVIHIETYLSTEESHETEKD